MPAHKRLFTYYLTNPKFTQKLLNTLPYSAQPLYVKSKYFAPQLKKRHLKALKAASERLGLDSSMIREDFSVREDYYLYSQQQDKQAAAPTNNYDKPWKKHGFIKNPTKIDARIEKRRVKIDKIVAALKTVPMSIYGHKRRLRADRRKSKLSPMRFSRVERRVDRLYMNRRVQHNSGRFHKTATQAMRGL